LVTRSTKLLGRTVRLQLRCPHGGQCTGVIKLRTAVRVRSASRQRITLGAKAFQIPANGRRTTPITVSRRIARALRTRSHVPLNAFITSRDEAGRSTFSRERITLRTR
ncbi:MAG TPA: hypothetical protein VGR11_14065, partial [Solirubrobacteraceae bacterium]|nr:hypothetical protein [Solirubrobacteraceae bacterium]